MSTAVAERKSTTPLADKIEAALDRGTAGGIALNAKGGLMIASMAEAMEFAKLMSLSGPMIPKHLRNNPGACLGICVQAYEWQINPFALAQKSYEVNDRTCYEASLYHAVVNRRAPIKGRIQIEYSGDGKTRRCKVWATLADDTGIVDYLSPLFDGIKPKNSPLWTNDPDQQLFYFSVRAFARRHFPDVMMGIYTVDEMQDASETLTAIQNAKPSLTLESLTAPKLAESVPQSQHSPAPQHDTTSAAEQREEPPETDSGTVDQSYEGRIARASEKDLSFIDVDLRDDPQLDQGEQRRLMELSAERRRVLTQQ